jgi:acylglycerol lipase
MVELADARFDLDYDGEDFTIALDATTELLGQAWAPPGPPRFVYVFAHGLGAFATFKKDFFYVVLGLGGAVFACDHRGHGRSPGARTVLTVADLIAETAGVARLARARYPGLPVVLHGHSMGGLAVIATVLRAFGDIDFVRGVIAEAPGISRCPSREAGPLDRLLLAGLARIAPHALIAPGVPVFSDDLAPAWVRLCRESPLYCFRVSARLLAERAAGQDYIRANARRWPAALPLLFLQGGRDAIVDARLNCEWAQAVIDGGARAVTVRVYPEGPHVMLKAPVRGDVVRDVARWLEALLGAPAENGREKSMSAPLFPSEDH